MDKEDVEWREEAKKTRLFCPDKLFEPKEHSRKRRLEKRNNFVAIAVKLLLSRCWIIQWRDEK